MKRLALLVAICLASPAFAQQQPGSYQFNTGVNGLSPELRTSREPAQLFWDDFSAGSLDVTNRWTAPTTSGSGVAASIPAPGSATMATGTTANSYSILSSQFSFPGKNPAWLFMLESNNFEWPVLTNALRFWGFATFPATPTATAPYVDAVGFELGTDGHLRAVTSAGTSGVGARNVIADLSLPCPTTQCSPNLLGKVPQPTDSGSHKYFIFYRGDFIIWAIDSMDNIVATVLTGALGPNVNTLPLAHLAVAASTGPSSSAVMTLNGSTIGDTGASEKKICDSVFGWRCVTVTAAGAISTTPTGGGTQTTASVGTAALATGQVSVATTVGGTSIVAARTGVVGTGRKSVCVTNVTGTAPVFIGNSGLTTSTGEYLAGVAGASICLDTQAAIFGIVSATAQTVSFTETF